MTLAGLILVGGGLAPLFWPNPWRYSQEKRELFQILRRHPRVQLKAIEVLNGATVTTMIRRIDPSEPARPAHALNITVSFPGDDVGAMTLFRQEVKRNPILSDTFPDPIVIFNCGWWVYDPSEPPNPPIEVGILFLPRTK